MLIMLKKSRIRGLRLILNFQTEHKWRWYGNNDLYFYNYYYYYYFAITGNRVKVQYDSSIRNVTVRNAKCLRRLVTNEVAALERHMILSSHMTFVFAKMTASVTATTIYLCTVFIVLFNEYVDSQDTDAQVRRFAK